LGSSPNVSNISNPQNSRFKPQILEFLRIFSIFNQVFEAQTQQHYLLIRNFLEYLVLYLNPLMVRFCTVAPFLHRIGPFLVTFWAWVIAPQNKAAPVHRKSGLCIIFCHFTSFFSALSFPGFLTSPFFIAAPLMYASMIRSSCSSVSSLTTEQIRLILHITSSRFAAMYFVSFRCRKILASIN
jgi:hypothetical protein